MPDRVLEMMLLARDKASEVFSKVGGSIDKLSSKMASAGKAMKSVGKSMTTYVSLPIVGAGVAVAKMAGDFEFSMNRVGAITGATGKDMEGLKNQAKELGRTTQFSASQAGEAMNFLGMAGFKTNQILSAMPATLQLAAAGNVELGEAADIASNILTGYRMEADKLGAVNDVLAKTFTSTNVDLRMLGESFKYVGPVAAGLGISFTETSAALGLLGNAGIQGSMAGTTLRSALVKITEAIDPMGKALNSTGEQIKSLGLNFYDNEGKIKSFTGIIKELEEKGVGTAEIMQIFGQRAGPGMAALVAQGSNALEGLVGDLKNAGGTAKEIADVSMKGFNGQMKALRSAVEAAAIAIAESGLLQWLTDMAQKLTDVFQKLAQTNPEILKIGTVVAVAVAAIGPLLIALGTVLQIGGPVLALIKTMASLIVTKLVPAIISIHVAGGPILWAIEAAIIAVGAAIALMTIDWLDAMKKIGLSSDSTLGKIFIWLSTAQLRVNQFGLWMVYITDWMVTGVVNLWEKMKMLTIQVWQNLQKIVAQVIIVLASHIASLAANAANMANALGIAAGPLRKVQEVAQNTAGTLRRFVMDVENASFAAKTHTSVLGLKATALEEINRLETEHAAKLRETTTATGEMVEATDTAIGELQGAGADLANQLAAGIEANKQTPINAVDDMFTEFDEFIDEFNATDAFQNGEDFVNSYADGMSEAAPAVQDVMNGISQTVGSAAKDTLDGISTQVELTQQQLGAMYAGLQKALGVAVTLPQTYEQYVGYTRALAGFQHGGIVTKPTAALIGEAGPEAVIPLNKMGGMGKTVIINMKNEFTGPFMGTPSEARIFAREILKYVEQEQARRG